MRRLGILILYLPTLVFVGVVPLLWFVVPQVAREFNAAMENRP